jgi:CubicO group peptidase (beta-lactamase class C family)
MYEIPDGTPGAENVHALRTQAGMPRACKMTTTTSYPTARELGLGQDTDLSPERRVDARNWSSAPYNRWAFQRVQQLTRTARIPRAAQPAPLPENPLEFGSLVFEDPGGLEVTIDSHLERTWTDGFLVMHQGAIVYEKYYNGMRPDTLHLMMSCSKSMTSTLLGIMHAEGVLDCDEPLTRYLPELVATGMDGATVQEALDMRVGLKFSEDYDDLDADWRDCEVATGWRRPATDYAGPRDMVGYMKTLQDTVGPHGDIFHYQSILTDALGICIERAGGQPFIDLFAERIWQPMGAEQDLVTIVDDSGTPTFEGGFNCCLRDFGRFAWLVCSGGRHAGLQLVPRRWIETCRHPGEELIKAFARGEYGAALPGHAYHNQWWVRDPIRGVLLAIGINGQMLYIDPDREFVAARFSSQPELASVKNALEQIHAFEAIADVLGD